MGKAILLGAGQGKRLLPLTADCPKCLLPVGNRTLLDWQIDAASACGIGEILVVTGFMAEKVEAHLDRRRQRQDSSVILRSLHNPFYAVSDNLATCFLSRHEMQGEFLLMNGDTICPPAVISRLLDGGTAPVVIATDRKEHYDADDMKIQVREDRLVDIGKNLTRDRVDGESVGILRFTGKGACHFVRTIETMMKQPESLGLWYLSAISALAADGLVGIVPVTGLPWGEVDFPSDLDNLNRLSSSWEHLFPGRDLT